MNFRERVKYAFTNELSETARNEIVTETIGTNPTIEQLEAFFGKKIVASGERLNSATYFACMQIRCNSFAKLPLKLKKYENKGSEDDVKHPLYKLFKNRPNPYMNTHDFLWATEFCRLHYGDAFWIPEFTKDKITAIYLTDNRQMRVMIDNAGIISKKRKNAVYYIFTGADGTVIPYTSEDICHFKNFPLNGLEGRSVSRYIYETIANEQLSTQMLNEKYSTGLQDPLVVEYSGDLGDIKQNAIKKKFADLGGVKNAGKVVPIPTEFKVHQLETKLVNSQFFQLQGLTTRQIANAFGVKSFQLNDMEKSTYNNVTEQNKAFYTDTLQNVLTAYEQEISYKLLTQDEQKDHYFKFNVDSILRSDLASRTASYATGINHGYMSVAEVREKEDLPFIPGTDKLIFGNGAAVNFDEIGKWNEGGGVGNG